MKSKGPELESLSSRFFAYVQLKKLDIVRTGEIAPILNITGSQERDRPPPVALALDYEAQTRRISRSPSHTSRR